MPAEPPAPIEGQLNAVEHDLLAGFLLGDGSTLTLLRTLHRLGRGRLWGIEADRCTYSQMLPNRRSATPDCGWAPVTSAAR